MALKIRQTAVNSYSAAASLAYFVYSAFATASLLLSLKTSPALFDARCNARKEPIAVIFLP